MKEEAKEWMKIASEEIQSVEALFGRRLLRMVCYHEQQAVEKGLRPFLLSVGWRFREPIIFLI